MQLGAKYHSPFFKKKKQDARGVWKIENVREKPE
jgi:hypothetical protein